MGRAISLELEARIRCLFETNWTPMSIFEHLKKSGDIVSLVTVYNVIRKRGILRQARESGINHVNKKSSYKVTPEMLRKLDKWPTSSNPITQELMAKKLGISQSGVSYLIQRKVNKRKRIKLKVHYLTPKNKQNRRTNAGFTI